MITKLTLIVSNSRICIVGFITPEIQKKVRMNAKENPWSRTFKYPKIKPIRMLTFSLSLSDALFLKINHIRFGFCLSFQEKLLFSAAYVRSISSNSLWIFLCFWMSKSNGPSRNWTSDKTEPFLLTLTSIFPNEYFIMRLWGDGMGFRQKSQTIPWIIAHHSSVYQWN